MSGTPAFQRWLGHDRAIMAAGLAVLCILAWIYVLTGAGLGMNAVAMTTLTLFPHKAAQMMAAMPGMAMAPQGSPLAKWGLTLLMWWSMMIAMMTPSATPAILLYGRVRLHALSRDPSAGVAPTTGFAAGYLLVWLGFSIAASALQWAGERLGLVSAATMGSQSALLSGALLLAAGVYQLSPAKDGCLRHCRSPAAFITRHWRPGTAGALSLGAAHGAYCLGCCWLLMALLFVGGVMNLAWIAVLTALVLAEKLAPGGRRIGVATGGLLIAWAVATLVL